MATATGQSQRLCSVWESLAGVISGFLLRSYPRIANNFISPVRICTSPRSFQYCTSLPPWHCRVPYSVFYAVSNRLYCIIPVSHCICIISARAPAPGVYSISNHGSWYCNYSSSTVAVERGIIILCCIIAFCIEGGSASRCC